MIYDFSGPLLDTEGEEIKIGGETLLLWHKLSEGLVNSKEGPAIKFLDWAILVRKEPHTLTLDRQDVQLIRNWIQTNGQPVLVRARLIEAMDESEKQIKKQPVDTAKAA